jgi:hypothetical protein
MKFFSITLIVLITSCTPRTTPYTPISDQYVYGTIATNIPERDSLVVTLGINGDTSSIGRYAVTEKGHLSRLKTGHWKEYCQSGNLKEEGEYKLGSLQDCCTGGPCMTYYHYKVGNWKYYNEGGKLVYEITYQPILLSVKTRCKDGEKVIFGVIKDVWRLNYLHNLSPDAIFNLQKVELEDDDFGTTVMIPLNGELLFHFKKK